MILGCSPLITSKLVMSLSGGAAVRLSTSPGGVVRSVGPEGDGEVARGHRLTRTCSIRERMARSATPFSCGGRVAGTLSG